MVWAPTANGVVVEQLAEPFTSVTGGQMADAVTLSVNDTVPSGGAGTPAVVADTVALNATVVPNFDVLAGLAVRPVAVPCLFTTWSNVGDVLALKLVSPL